MSIIQQHPFLLCLVNSYCIYKPITTHQNDVGAIGYIGLFKNQNHLSLNISKTKFMLISLQCPHVLLDGSLQLEQVSHSKYLGVWISADLSWSKHIMTVTFKSRRLLGYIIRTFSPHCSPTAIMTLYRAHSRLWMY